MILGLFHDRCDAIKLTAIRVRFHNFDRCPTRRSPIHYPSFTYHVIHSTYYFCKREKRKKQNGFNVSETTYLPWDTLDLLYGSLQCRCTTVVTWPRTLAPTRLCASVTIRDPLPCDQILQRHTFDLRMYVFDSFYIYVYIITLMKRSVINQLKRILIITTRLRI